MTESVEKYEARSNEQPIPRMSVESTSFLSGDRGLIPVTRLRIQVGKDTKLEFECNQRSADKLLSLLQHVVEGMRAGISIRAE